MKYKVTNIHWDTSSENENLPESETIEQEELTKIPEGETLFDDEESALTLYLFEKYGNYILSFDYEVE